MNKKYIFGASGHAKVIIDILISNNIEIEAIIDDAPKTEILSNIKVLHSKKFKDSVSDLFIIAIGSNDIRKKIALKNTFNYFNAIHKTAFVSNFASLGLGSVVMPKAVINSGANIGNHCIVNSGAVVEHDCQIKDFVHISPNATLSGSVKVDEGTHIGAGSVVIQGIHIGKWATIGAGSTVIDNVPNYAVVVGCPAKIIKYNNFDK